MADTSPPSSPSALDALRMQALIFEELRRIQQLLTERLLPLAPTPAVPAADKAVEDEHFEWLRQFQVLLLQHPVAAQALFSALVAEGRRFATTPEGEAWKAALAGSDLVRNGRQLWEALSLNLLEEDASTVVPTTYLEAIFRASSSPEMETLIRRLWSAGNTGDEGDHGAR